MSTAKPLYIQAIEALRNREALFRIFIFTLVTVLFWIGFSVFFSQQKTKVAVDTQKHTAPLNPNINKSTLEELVTRKTFTDQELENFPIYDRVIGEDKKSALVIAGTVSEGAPVETSALPSLIATSSATTTSENATPSATPQFTPEASSSGGF